MCFMNFHPTHEIFTGPVNMPAKRLVHFFWVTSSNCGRTSLPWKQIAPLLWQTLGEFSNYERHLTSCQKDMMLFLIHRIKKVMCLESSTPEKTVEPRQAKGLWSGFLATGSHTKSTACIANMKISLYLISAIELVMGDTTFHKWR